MRKTLAFLALLAVAAIDVSAVRAGMFPAWSLAIGIALAVIAVVVATLAVIEGTANCQVCGQPLADRRRAGDYALKYGVRACGDCGGKLDDRFRDEPSEPPSMPPGFP